MKNKRPFRERRSMESSTPQNHQQISQRLAELEQQRRNLLSLVCRILRAAPEYRLRPSELAVENVGDLSFLSRETIAYWYNRMERETPARTKSTMASESCKGKLLGILHDARELETGLIELYASMPESPDIPFGGQCGCKCSEAPAPRAPRQGNTNQDYCWVEIPRRVKVYRTDSQAQ